MRQQRCCLCYLCGLITAWTLYPRQCTLSLVTKPESVRLPGHPHPRGTRWRQKQLHRPAIPRLAPCSPRRRGGRRGRSGGCGTAAPAAGPKPAAGRGVYQAARQRELEGAQCGNGGSGGDDPRCRRRYHAQHRGAGAGSEGECRSTANERLLCSCEAVTRSCTVVAVSLHAVVMWGWGVWL